MKWNMDRRTDWLSFSGEKHFDLGESDFISHQLLNESNPKDGQIGQMNQMHGQL